MFCHNCGKEIEDDILFCPHCGAKQEEELESEHVIHHVKKPEHFHNREHENEQRYQEHQRYQGNHQDHHKSNDSNTGMKVLIAVLVVLVLVCGSVGGYFWYSSNQKQQALAQKTQEAADAAKEAKAAKKASEEAYSEDEVTVDGKSVTSDSTNETNSNSSDSTSAKGDIGTQNAEPAQTTPTVTHEYTVIYQMMTWEEAQSYCLSQGGHLATATSESEYSELLDYANQSGLKVLWLGASRNASTGEFAWSTGEDFTFASWASGEPNNDQGNESYLGIMYVGGVWAMYDLPNDLSPYYSSANVGFIMEKDITQ